MPNPWKEVATIGQSLWYDNLSREFIQNGKLAGMIESVGMKGITSNPSIFEKSIASSAIYDEDIHACVRDGMTTDEIYDKLTTDDIRATADIMRPVYDSTNGLDGYVSIEVDPRIANDADASLDAARRLWKLVDRPNIMIKIPGTPECIPAVRQCLTEGINVNITLLFGIENYTQVANAYLDALNTRKQRGEDVTKIASVASFFLSRVDTNVDKELDTKIAAMNGEGKEMRKLLGTAANANAKLAYERYLEIFHGAPFKDLAAAGARPQRCLWASVSTKNPQYSDVLYIEPLIGPETVTTVPDETIVAFADHGKAANTLATGITEAHETIDKLRLLGIDTERVAAELQIDGVKKFADSFATLAKKLEAKRHAVEEAAA
jgi:transaldolase